jgi:hypothetical protein
LRLGGRCNYGHDATTYLPVCPCDPVASIVWTITHEEVIREFRETCHVKSAVCRRLYQRKFFYLFTCEYCFSHYVALIFLIITRFQLLYPDWRGYLIALFSLVWVANVYMSLFGMIRLDLKKERVQIAKSEAAQSSPPSDDRL